MGCGPTVVLLHGGGLDSARLSWAPLTSRMLAMPPAPGGSTAYAAGVLVLAMSGDRISSITRFLDTDLPRQLGLAHEELVTS